MGPNGAGKTTTVECVIGLRSPDRGVIRVMGLDPQADREELHMIVGAQLQASALPGQLKVGEILDLYHSFYPGAADPGEIMGSLALAETRNACYESLSGGLKQRVSVALALIGNPKVAVLDEMTTGLDPQARRDTWHLIEQRQHVRGRGGDRGPAVPAPAGGAAGGRPAVAPGRPGQDGPGPRADRG